MVCMSVSECVCVCVCVMCVRAHTVETKKGFDVHFVQLALKLVLV